MALLGAQFVNAVSPNPVGSLQAYAGASAPTGWLLCDGTSYTTAAYPELYSVLGYTYGGSGANFNVPDLRGRMPIGAGNDGVAANNEARTRGTKGGDTRMPQHGHQVRVNSFAGDRQVAAGPLGADGDKYSFSDSGNDASTSTALLYAANNGSGTGDNMPPFLVTNYIIKAIPDAPRSGLAYGSTPPIVTALPANPQFGDVVTYLPAAGTQPTTYQWNGSTWYAIGDRVAHVQQSTGAQTLNPFPASPTGMSHTANFTGRPVAVNFSCFLNGPGAGHWISFRCTLDGAAQGYDRAIYMGGNMSDVVPSFEWMFTPSAGSHTIAIVAQVGSASNWSSQNRQMIIKEF